MRLLLIVSAWASLTIAATPAQAAGDDDAQVPERIAAAISRLGSDAFQERQQAQDELLTFGEPARKALEAAASGDDRETASRAKAILEAFRKRQLAEADVYVFGLYECEAEKAVVEVRETERPVILVLCAYEAVAWSVQPAEGARILAVFAAGYERQQVEGTTAPVSTYSYEERTTGPDGESFYFFTYDHDEERYPDMVAKVQQLTGKKPAAFQGRYGYIRVPFVVGGND